MKKDYIRYFEGASGHVGEPNEKTHPSASKNSRAFGADFVHLIENKKTKNVVIQFWYLEINNRTLEVDYRILTPTVCLLENVSMELTKEATSEIIFSVFFQYFCNHLYKDTVDIYSFKNVESEAITILSYPYSEESKSKNLGGLKYDNLIDNVSHFKYDSAIENINQLKYDGLYITSCDFKTKNEKGSQEYLRFYPDGNVIALSAHCDEKVEEISSRFNVSNEHIGQGTYKNKGKEIELFTSTTLGSRNYNGEIDEQGKLKLKINSLISGYKTEREYFFVKIDDLKSKEISLKTQPKVKNSKPKKEISKKESLDFTDNFYRNFKHPDGRVAWVLIKDCRFSFGLYKVENSKHARKEDTKLSIEDAQKTARTKIQKWLKDGFVEVESTPEEFNLNANVIDVFRSVVPNHTYPGATNAPIFNYMPVPNEPNLYKYYFIGSSSFLLCSNDLTKGIKFSSNMYKLLSSIYKDDKESYLRYNEGPQPFSKKDTPNEILDHNEKANQLISIVKHYKEEILADNKTPVRKLLLKEPIGNYTHLAILSPTVYNQKYPGTITIGRSIWEVFLCFENQFNNNDSVSTAEARMITRKKSGNQIPYFVFDVKFIKNIEKPEKDFFKVFDPSSLEFIIGTKAFSMIKYPASTKAIDIRNYKGETYRVLPNQVVSEADMEGIRAFLIK